MKTRFAVLSTLVAAAIACGGPQQKSDPAAKQTVFVETDSAIVIGDVAVTGVEVSAVGIISGAVGPFALTYDPAKGTFKGNLYLVPDTYTLTTTAKKLDGTVIGTATTNNVVVTATAVANVAINIPSTLEALPPVGFVITGFTFAGYVNVGDSAAFSVSTAQTGAAPTFAWTAKKVSNSGTNCAGAFAPNAASASVTFTGSAADICTITVTVTDSVNTNIKATRTATLGVGLNTSVTGQFIPSPTITKVELVGNGGYDATWNPTPTCSEGKCNYFPKRALAEAACTLYRVDTMVGTTLNRANETCPGAYKINSGIALPLPTWDGTAPAPTITLTPPLFSVGVTYDLGGIYSATTPPKVGLDVACANATGAVSTYTAAAPIVGSGPGSATCPAAPAVCTGSAALWFTEPTAIVAPAVGDLCTLTVTVNNQGSLDTFPVRMWFAQ